MDGDHKDPTAEVIEYPENWKDMKEKYLEREKEQLERVMARRKAETAHELELIATKAIVTRANRAAAEHKPLRDHTILTEPKGEEIQELRKKLHAEITAIGQRIFKREQQEEQKAPNLDTLKGRVSQTPYPSADENVSQNDEKPDF